MIFNRTVLFIAGILVPVLIIEMTLRLLGLGNMAPQLTMQSDIYGFDHKPNASGEYKSEEYATQVKINFFGLRGEEITLEKQKGVKRIALVGDSFVEGLQVEVNETVAKKMESYLNSLSSQKYQVLNFGVSGFGLDQKFLYIKNKVIKFDPDIIILFFANNDLDDIKRNGLVKIEGDRLVMTNSALPKPETSFLKNIAKHFAIVNYIFPRIPTNFLYNNKNKSTPIEYKLLENTKDDEVENLLGLGKKLILSAKDAAETQNTRFILISGVDSYQIDQTKAQDLSKSYNLAGFNTDFLSNDLSNFAEENNIEFLNLLPRFQREYNYGNNPFFHKDGHWNRNGHKAAANEIGNYIINTQNESN